MAIIRVGQLERKDSYMLLNSVLDDKLEDEANRELAALFMQKLNHELHLGFFLSNSYLSRFTGNEDVNKLINVAVIDTFPDINFHFENSLIESQLNFDNEFLKSNMDEKADEFPFSFKEWVSHCSAGILLDIKKGFKNLAWNLFICYPKKFITWVGSLPKRLSAHKESRNESEKSKPKNVPCKRTKVYTYHPPLASRIKNILRTFTNILLFPFRFIVHFKWPILITLVLVYSLLSFTQPGKLYLFRISPQAYYLNTDFLARTKITVMKTISKNETLAAVFVTAAPSSSETPEKDSVSKLKVTAPKGLYLRSEPITTAKKLVLMDNSTIVEFMGEEKRDSSGTKWFKIRINEATGWANAQWLGEV